MRPYSNNIGPWQDERPSNYDGSRMRRIVRACERKAARARRRIDKYRLHLEVINLDGTYGPYNKE